MSQENLRVLVLDFVESTRIAFCFELKVFRTLRVKLPTFPESREPSSPQTCDFLVFPSDRQPDSDGIISLDVAEVMIEKPTPDDCIYEKKSEPRKLLRSWIGFSTNPLHQTYNRQFAYSDWYGIVDSSDFHFADNAQCYSAIIAINDLDFVKNGTCLFKIVQVLHTLGVRKTVVLREQIKALDESFKVTEVSRTTPLVMKEDVQLSMLVLEVKGSVIVGFETNKLQLLSVRVDGTDTKVSPWQTIEFIAGQSEDGTTTVKVGTSLTIVSPPENGVQKTADGTLKIPTSVAFSSNNHHLSYSKNVAVSDRYGYIALQPSKGQLYEMTQYCVDITLDQISNPRKPIFKAISDLKFQNEWDPSHHCFEVIIAFEERMLLDFKNNLGAVEIPHSSDLKRKEVVRPRNSLRSSPEKNSTYYTALYYEMRQDTGMMWTPKGDAIVLGSVVVARTGERVSLGDWVEVRLEDRHGRICVTKVADKSTTDMPMLKRNESGREQIFVMGELELTANPEWENMGVRLYKHNVLGLVEVNSQFHHLSSIIVEVEFRKISNPPIINGERVYWIVNKIVQEIQTSQKPPRVQPSSVESNGAIGGRYNQMNGDVVQTMSFPMTSKKDVFKSGAIVTAARKNFMLVFLDEIKHAAYLPPNSQKLMPHLGQTFECEYVEDRYEEEGDLIKFKVTRILRIVEGKQDMKIQNDEIVLAVHVNMYAKNEDWANWYKFGGQPIMNSDDVGLVILDKRVEGPDGKTIDGKQLSEIFAGEERSKNMVGWCKYARQTMTRAMYNKNFIRDENLDFYVWKMIKLDDAADEFNWQQNTLTRENVNLNAPFRTPQNSLPSAMRFRLDTDVHGRMQQQPGYQGTSRNCSSQGFFNAAGNQYYASLPSPSTCSVVSDSKIVTPASVHDAVKKKDDLLRRTARTMNMMRNTLNSVLQDKEVMMAIHNVDLQDFLDIKDHLDYFKKLTKTINNQH